MKLFIKLMMFMLVAAVAGPFILKGPNGQPLMSYKDLLPSFSLPRSPLKSTPSNNNPSSLIEWSSNKSKEHAIAAATDNEGKPIAAESNVYYRWKDKNGVWQFTSTPNPSADNIKMAIDPNANVMQSLSKDKIDKAFGREPTSDTLTTSAGKPSTPSTEAPMIPFPATIPVTEIPKLIEQAKGVQGIVDQRKAAMDAVLKQ